MKMQISRPTDAELKSSKQTLLLVLSHVILIPIMILVAMFLIFMITIIGTAILDVALQYASISNVGIRLHMTTGVTAAMSAAVVMWTPFIYRALHNKIKNAITR